MHEGVKIETGFVIQESEGQAGGAFLWTHHTLFANFRGGTEQNIAMNSF